jgi:hypothetical protein
MVINSISPFILELCLVNFNFIHFFIIFNKKYIIINLFKDFFKNKKIKKDQF